MPLVTPTRAHFGLAVGMLKAPKVPVPLDPRFDWTTHGRPHQQPPPGDWRTWLILAGRGWGKALALDTPIPTPDGWTTMGMVHVGDTVLDEQGQPCRVTFATEVQLGRPCFDVEFSDGTVITADAEHRWLTSTKQSRKESARNPRSPLAWAAVRTTAEIAATLRVGLRAEVNHAVPCTAPLPGTAQRLPIDPYVFGVWLGDGDSATAALTTVDEPVLAEVAAAGYPVSRLKPQQNRTPRYSIGTRDYARDPITGRMCGNGSLHSTLRGLGLLRAKRIPLPYLRASMPQRMALLQGLMDTDGSVEACGRCEFTTISEHLADNVFELVASLGFKPTIQEGRATLNGRDCGPKYRVRFTAHRPVFRLPRKLARQHSGKAQQQRVAHRYIVDVRHRPSVPVRCIQVDSPSHLFLASRAFIPTHNTRTGAEWVRAQAEAGTVARLALVAPTAADVRDVMVEGESGILAISPPHWRPLYEPSKRRLTWPNGVMATTYSADEPDRLRGPQHGGGWADEVAAWKYPETWDMLQFGMRLGTDPRQVVTTTPRPIKLLRDLIKQPSTVITRGATSENADNLAPAFLEQIVARYAGTRLGRQELEGELLDDIEGALWQRTMFDERRPAPDLTRIVVAVDPAATSGEQSDETGIIVAGLGVDGHGYILADRSCRLSPDGWARRVVCAVDEFGADRVIVEVNNGGEMVTQTLQTVRPLLPITAVHASRGKQARAEPVAALYEQKRVWHVAPFDLLEDQCCSWTTASGQSPDRLDALVWALTNLIVDAPSPWAFV